MERMGLKGTAVFGSFFWSINQCLCCKIGQWQASKSTHSSPHHVDTDVQVYIAKYSKGS